MSLIIDNTKLDAEVTSAIAQSGLRAEVNTLAFGQVSYISKIRFTDTVSLAGETFRPQLYVFNRNNGKSAMKVLVGLFRLVCSNGLIIPAFQDSAHALRIIHRDCNATRTKLDQLPSLIQQGLESIAGLGDSIAEMQALEVTEQQAIQVIGNLSVSDDVKRTAIRNVVFTEKRRPEDSANNAWTVYNITNEAIRKVHGFNLTALQADTNLFQDVLDLTQSMKGVA